MTDNDNASRDLYVAAFCDPNTAQDDWNTLKRLAADDVIEVEALALVTRDHAGTIHVKDPTYDTDASAAIGAIGGALVGSIFPPELAAPASVGAGIGASAGALVDRPTKQTIKSYIEWTVPLGGSGLVVIFDEQWANQVERILIGASQVSRIRTTHDADTDTDPGG